MPSSSPMDRQGNPDPHPVLETPKAAPEAIAAPASKRTIASRESTSPFITASQKAALEQVMRLSRLAGAAPLPSGIAPRVFPLLVGPSGAGKTAVLRKAAKRGNRPLLIVNSGSWIVEGAREGNHSLDIIRRFVRDNNRGVVFIDEIDKCSDPSDRSSWALSVCTELISLLDQDSKLTTAGWTEDDIAKLQAKFMLVGAGAWQVVANAQGHHLGFGGMTRGDYHTEMLRQSAIPEELLYRFNLPAIVLSLPTAQDFTLGVAGLHRELRIPKPRPAELKGLAESAVASKLGMRWLEQYLSSLLIRNRKKGVRRRYVSAKKEDAKPGNKWREVFVQVCTSAEAATRLYLFYSDQLIEREYHAKQDWERERLRREKSGLPEKAAPSFLLVKTEFGEKSRFTAGIKEYREWFIQQSVQSRQRRADYLIDALKVIHTGLTIIRVNMVDFRRINLKYLCEIQILSIHTNVVNILEDTILRISALTGMSTSD